MLDTKLSDHLTNMGNLFSNATAFHRPGFFSFFNFLKMFINIISFNFNGS